LHHVLTYQTGIMVECLSGCFSFLALPAKKVEPPPVYKVWNHKPSAGTWVHNVTLEKLRKEKEDQEDRLLEIRLAKQRREEGSRVSRSDSVISFSSMFSENTLGERLSGVAYKVRRSLSNISPFGRTRDIGDPGSEISCFGGFVPAGMRSEAFARKKALANEGSRPEKDTIRPVEKESRSEKHTIRSVEKETSRADYREPFDGSLETEAMKGA